MLPHALPRTHVLSSLAWQDLSLAEAKIADPSLCRLDTWLDALPPPAKAAFVKASPSPNGIGDDALRCKLAQLLAMAQHRHGLLCLRDADHAAELPLQALSAYATVADDKVVHVSLPFESVESTERGASCADLLVGRYTSTVEGVDAGWVDGSLTRALRDANATETPTWIVLDGPLEASAIECKPLFSLLDDNKKLSLGSGEAVPLPAHTRIVILAKGVGHCSAALVSRLGVVQFDGSDGKQAARSYCAIA